ncbi:MAG: KpsF/GutQ family sugar-phosphate isomerase [Phycisphaeraceae bacterium]|nr:MAG: KpsF/GutQ family sugar-phosphate isomerase [Phycisphaeraceae bacterium]
MPPGTTPARRPVMTETVQDDMLDFARRALRAEADAILRMADAIGPEFEEAVGLIVKTADTGGSVVVAGMGKSGLIGQKISATLASLGVPSHWVHPADAAHGDLGRVRAGDCLLALSYSGTTEEVVAFAAILRQDGVPVITITSGRGGSPLERLATISLGVGVVEEACPLSLAPTSSTTATLALGDALALAASRKRSFSPDDFARRHPGGLLGGLLRPVTEILRFTAGANLPVVPESLSVAEALRQASEIGRRPGALVVVDGEGALAGIFTDSDLRRLVLRDASELARPIAEVMTRSPRALSHTALVRDAVHMVREHRQDEIPVIDERRRPVGILDVQDLIAMKVVRD